MELLKIFFVRWLVTLGFAGLVISSFYILFWVIAPKYLQKFRIAQPQKHPLLLKLELKRSVLGLSVYLIPSALLYFTQLYWNYTPMYTDINDFGIEYLFFTFFLLVVVVDTWFYWSHRLMHWHPFFIKAHLVHHESYNINPFSAYSVDLIHGILNMIPYGLVLLFVPWHPIPVAAFGLFSVVYNCYIHLGYDFKVNFFMRFKFLKYIYTANHHSIHHQNYSYNFAAYFTFWDKLMKTEKRASEIYE